MPAIRSASLSVRPYFSPSAFAHNRHTLEFRINTHHLSVGVASKGNLSCFLIVTGIDFFLEDLARNVESNFTLHN